MARKKRMKDIKPSLKEETCEDLRKEFPQKLVDLFVQMHDSNYDDEKIYNKYKKESNIFLKNLSEDKIEQSKLIVRLTKATFDLVKKEAKNEKEKKKKQVKTKKTS